MLIARLTADRASARRTAAAAPKTTRVSTSTTRPFAALIAVTGAALLLAGQQGVFAVIFATAGGPKGVTAFSWFLGHMRRGGDVGGPAVAGAWAVLIVSGVGRRPGGWLSWASCVLGGRWVFWWFLLPPVFYLIPLLR